MKQYSHYYDLKCTSEFVFYRHVALLNKPYGLWAKAAHWVWVLTQTDGVFPWEVPTHGQYLTTGSAIPDISHLR